MSENNRRLNSRLNQKHRKKKTNMMLNVLIGIVLVLIIVTVVNIVTDDEVKESAVDPNTSPIANNKDDTMEDSTDTEEENSATEQVNAQDETNSESSVEDKEEVESETAEESTGTLTVTTVPSSGSNVESEIVESGWQPIGTTQTGEHISSYDKNSVDWEEKVEALAYAANLDKSNMYVKHLGNGGSPQKSIGTVTSKDGSEIYRISLEWVDGQGWKPTKKEKLNSLDEAS